MVVTRTTKNLLRRAIVAAVVLVVAFLATDTQPASAASASAVSAGNTHTCALTTAGGLRCWGLNDFGQLGDATTTDRTTPVDVVGLTSGVAAVAAGEDYTCGLTTPGGLKCWGSNNFGQLGDGTGGSFGDRSTTPVDVSGLTSGVAAVSAGFVHTCALTTAGGLKCWGRNDTGRLGDGTTTNRITPVDVSGLASGVAAVSAGGGHTCALTTAGGLKCWGSGFADTPMDVTGLTSGVAAVSVGGSHTCALTTAGGLKCWGRNKRGQLGDGTATDRATPVDVVGLTGGVAAVSAGSEHTCALTTAGGLKCWGRNGGALGDGTNPDRTAPVDVSGLTSGVAAVAAGSAHTCAVTTVSGLKCWGSNASGQLGDGTGGGIRITPVGVVGLTNGVAAVSAGGHTCALTTAGGLKCWGRNFEGEVGDGTQVTRTTPVDVVGLTSGVGAVSAGNFHTCAVTTTGGLKCWGSNSSFQLGDGTTTQRITPVDVVGLTSGVAAVSAGHHTCALTTTGGLKCWGSNQFGSLGDGTTTNSTTPVDVVGLTSGVGAVSGGVHTCAAVTTAGGLKCWGRNFLGQLGDGTTTNRTTPVDVTGLNRGVAAVSAGRDHTCALTTAGGLKCWGLNGSGELGDGTTTTRTMPVDVAGLASGVAAVSAGAHHTCAVTTAGGLKCWGANAFGQLGDGTNTGRTTPVDVSGLTSGVAAVAAGNSHTCAVTAAGGLKCWGANGGRLGDGTTTSRNTPVDVVGLTSGVAAVSAGGSYTCAVTTAGGLKCWGANTLGQLGDGATLLRFTPVDVVGFEGVMPTLVPSLSQWALIALALALATAASVSMRRRPALKTS